MCEELSLKPNKLGHKLIQQLVTMLKTLTVAMMKVRLVVEQIRAIVVVKVVLVVACALKAAIGALIRRRADKVELKGGQEDLLREGLVKVALLVLTERARKLVGNKDLSRVVLLRLAVKDHRFKGL